MIDIYFNKDSEFELKYIVQNNLIQLLNSNFIRKDNQKVFYECYLRNFRKTIGKNFAR